MENQNKPLLIRPSRTPKRIPKINFCPKSFPTIGASTRWCSCVFSYDSVLAGMGKQVSFGEKGWHNFEFYMMRRKGRGTQRALV